MVLYKKHLITLDFITLNRLQKQNLQIKILIWPYAPDKLARTSYEANVQKYFT